MKLILLGAPGAGKGTQAEIVCDKLNIPAISTGNILREAMKNETEMGVKAKAFIDSGALVPDDVIIGIIKERLAQDDCKNGFILDGVPRTVGAGRGPRGDGRRHRQGRGHRSFGRAYHPAAVRPPVCSACGASYHTTAKPSVKPDVCDRCGGALIVRKDDEPATILERLKVYHELTEPLVDFYRERGKLVVVEGQEEVADTTRLLLEKLGVSL